MAIKVGINGFGWIGRQFFRAKLKHDKDNNVEIVSINDLYPTRTLAHLLKYDSVYGMLDNDIRAEDDALIVDGQKIKVTSIKDPAELPWGDMGVEVAIESTGIFRTRETTQKHIDAGAKKVIVSAPCKTNGADITIVNTEDIAANQLCSRIKGVDVAEDSAGAGVTAVVVKGQGKVHHLQFVLGQ